MGTGRGFRGSERGGYLLLYGALYGGYGALSPFLPAFLQSRGLAPGEISALLAAAMVVRLAAGPVAGRIADRTGATRALLAGGFVLAGALCLGLLPARGFWLLLGIGLLHAAATAPLAPLSDALALTASRGGRAFAYGTVRGAGSAAFIAATLAAGPLVAAAGPGAGLWACAALFALAGGATVRLGPAPNEAGVDREGTDAAATDTAHGAGLRALLALPRYRRLVSASALVIGAHALHDAFAVIAWTAAGLSPTLCGVLWSLAVAAEVAVFLGPGPRIVAALGPGPALALAACAGALRWAVQALTTAPALLAAIQCLHGLTFALLHLACLRAIEAWVPPGLRATALTVYGTFGLGLASAALTLAAGPLYARFGLAAFLAMSLVSLAAVPVALSLTSRRSRPTPSAPI